MGIWAKIKKMFTKNIECDEDLKNHIIYLYPSKGRVVNVCSKIVVNDGYCAIFVCNDKICDVLPSGSHKITGVTLPISFSRLKLDKQNKKGKYPKKFKADIYFINNEEINNYEFNSKRPFRVKSSMFGRVKGFFDGSATIKILEPEKLLKNFLSDRAYIKNKTSAKKLDSIIENNLNDSFERLKLEFGDVIINPKMLNENLNLEINKRSQHFGIKIKNIEINSIRLNKKMQEKVNEYLLERKSFEEQFANTGIKFDETSVDFNNQLENDLNSQKYVENDITPQQFVEKDISPEIINRGSSIQFPEENINQNSYVANNLNTETELLNSNNKKICKYCGATIDIDYLYCPKCGFKQ